MRRKPARCRRRQQRHRSQKQRRGEQGRWRRRTADTWWLSILLHYFTAGSSPDVHDMSISPEQLPLKVGYDHATHLESLLHHPQPMVAAHALQSLRALHTAITVDSSPRASLQRSLSGGRATAPQLLHAPPVQLVWRESPHVIGPDLFCAGRKSMQLGLDRQREPGGGGVGHTSHVTRHTPHATRHKFHVHLSLKQPLSPEHDDPNTPLHRVRITYHYNPKPLLTCNSCTRWCLWRYSAVHQAAASGGSSLSARMLRAK
jgi:hypothetical protein